MATTIKGNLVLKKDTVFDESIEVHGSILGKDGNRYDLKVKGDISAWDISAWDISALDISARFIICETIKQKKGSKLIAWKVLTHQSRYDLHEITKKELEG